MIDDRTVHHLLDHIACQVLDEMSNGNALEDIDEDLRTFLRKVDRIAVFERIVECFLVNPEEASDPITARKLADAVAAHLRTLKRQKRLPQPTRPPATVIALRPEDRPDL